MAGHANNNVQTKQQVKGSKKIAITVAAVFGIIVTYCAMLAGSVLQTKKHVT